MLKKFTTADRFESGIDSIITGKKYAFVPITGDSSFVALGVAIADDPGTYPIAIGWCYATSYREMAAHAIELNRGDGIDDETAAQTIKSVLPEGTGERSAALSKDFAHSPVAPPERRTPDQRASVEGQDRQRKLLWTLFRKMWFRSHRLDKNG